MNVKVIVSCNFIRSLADENYKRVLRFVDLVPLITE